MKRSYKIVIALSTRQECQQLLCMSDYSNPRNRGEGLQCSLLKYSRLSRVATHSSVLSYYYKVSEQSI